MIARSVRGHGNFVRFKMFSTVSVFAIVLASVVSLAIGPTHIEFQDFWQTFVGYDSTLDTHFALRDLRLPRTILAGLVGAALSTSGALMQGVTRNLLAGPSIMGLSTGGTLFLLVGILLNHQLTYTAATLWSLSGAAVGYLAVCAVTLLSRSGMTPAGFALAGAVVSAVFGAITHGLTICYSLHDEFLFWTVGGISHVTWQQVIFFAPICLIGCGAAVAVSSAITVLSLGEEIAAGLGQKTTTVRLVASMTVLLLTGGAIAVSGPIGFVGIVVPHLARLLVGVDYRQIIPISITIGACMTILADTAARSMGGQEFPMGLFTTFIGAPFFVYLARRRSSSRMLGD